MDQKEYLELISFSLKEMDCGYYSKSLEKFERIVKSDFSPTKFAWLRNIRAASA